MCLHPGISPISSFYKWPLRTYVVGTLYRWMDQSTPLWLSTLLFPLLLNQICLLTALTNRGLKSVGWFFAFLLECSLSRSSCLMNRCMSSYVKAALVRLLADQQHQLLFMWTSPFWTFQLMHYPSHFLYETEGLGGQPNEFWTLTQSMQLSFGWGITIYWGSEL